MGVLKLRMKHFEMMWIALVCFVALTIHLDTINAQNERYDLPAGEVNGEQTYVISWSLTGEYIATGNQGGYSLWNGQTGELIGRYPLVSSIRPDFAPFVTEIVWSPNSTQIAVRLRLRGETVIQTINISDNSLAFAEIEGGVSSGLDWSPDGSTLVVLNQRHFPNDRVELQFYNMANGELSRTFPLSQNDVTTTVKWSPDGSKIAADFITNTTSDIIVWDVTSLDEISRLPHPTAILDFDWNFDGTFLASIDGLEERRLRIWNASSSELLNTLDVVLPSDLAWNPTENVIAVESRNTIYILDATTGSILNQTTRFVDLISWNPFGTALATISGTTPLIYTRDGQELPQFPLMVGYNITDIQTNVPIRRVNNNDVINLAELEDVENLVIQAFPNRAPIQSVSLELNGVVTIFNEAPYILPLPSAGTYTLTGIPYSEPDAQGIEGTPLTLNFTIVDE